MSLLVVVLAVLGVVSVLVWTAALIAGTIAYRRIVRDVNALADVPPSRRPL